MTRVAIGRVLLMAVGGAAGGFVTYLLINPSLAASEQEQEGYRDISQLIEVGLRHLGHLLWLGVAVGAMIGVALIIVEDAQSGNVVRLFQRALRGCHKALLIPAR